MRDPALDTGNNSRLGSNLSGFLLGAVIGAGLALLLAPAEGRETRRRLGNTARKLRDGARQRLNQSRQTVGDLKEDARAAIGAGRDAFQQRRTNRLGTDTNVGEPIGVAPEVGQGP